MVNRLVAPRFSVSDFLAVANQALETAFGSVEIEGEVSSFKVNHQKFVFFDLKDNDGSVGCFMTVWQLRMQLEDGMRVVIRAVPKLTAWGKFSLTVQDIRPIGEGSIKRNFELMKKKLSDEGLFDEARKRPLPEFPSRVAVISSVQAAGYADFMKIAAERWGGVKFTVFHCQVQGDQAADQMVEALAKAQQLAEVPDAIVLIRGGGSADDLASFNDEKLVREIAASRVPVLTGIGHEVDESLADLAADVRASTPSNAAQMLLPDKREVLARIGVKLQSVVALSLRAIDKQIESVKSEVESARNIWLQAVESKLQEVRAQQKLAAELDPELVLKRGYAIIRGDCRVGEQIEIVTKNEIMKARVEKYEKRHDN